MGEGSIHETVLSLMLSKDFSRRRVVSWLRSLDSGESRGHGQDLFADMPPAGVDALGDAHDGLAEARRVLADLTARDIGVTSMADADYPMLLKEIHNPPPILFYRGDLPDTALGAVAIVGSRKASLSGTRFAHRLAEELAGAGLIVVSGMARGIDTAAHQGAVAAGGETIAVLGCGIDVVYPPENEDLMGAIAASGAVVTEFLPGVEPLRPNFPQRNRIISGLSLGTVVVEAGERSGALITASSALEQNRSVFAVPGTPGFCGSRGTNALLKQGAKLVESVDDVLEEVAPQIETANAHGDQASSGPPEDPTENRILEALSSVPVHVDELCRGLDLTSREVVKVLFELETRGQVRSMPGKFYVRVGDI
jgi:DNA processing protein